MKDLETNWRILVIVITIGWLIAWLDPLAPLQFDLSFLFIVTSYNVYNVF